jgi:hypothetical protein
MTTLMLSINDECYEILANQARRRGVNVQMLLRAVIIPEWTGLYLDSKVSTVSDASGSRTNSDNTNLEAPISSHIAVAKIPWREVDTYRSLYFRNVRR